MMMHDDHISLINGRRIEQYTGPPLGPASVTGLP